MYETTVSVTANMQHLLDYVQTQIQPCITQIDGVATGNVGKNRRYYTVACSDTYKRQLQHSILECISKVLVVGCKNVFLRDELQVDSNNFYQNLLVNTICVIDSDYDKQIMQSVIDVNETICIDGYFNFRMDSLKRKWQELCSLISDGNQIIFDYDVVVEFLQYILQSVQSKATQVDVTFGENNFTIFSKGKALPIVQSLSASKDIWQELLLNMICINAKKVKIFCNDKPPQQFCDVADALFDMQYVFVD